MSKSLASAAEHLKKARDHLSLVKAQYQSAEATYESAKSLYEALESSQTIRAESNTQHSQLCESCKAIPIRNIFQQQPISRPHRRKVGDLFTAVENQSSLRLLQIPDRSLSNRKRDPVRAPTRATDTARHCYLLYKRS